MTLDETMLRLRSIPGAAVGQGPSYPDVGEWVDDPVERFLDSYPILLRDTGYVEFLKNYSGVLIKNPDETQIIDILGFSDVSTGVLEMEGPVVDDEGFLLFSQCVFHTVVDGKLVDTYEYDFAFDTSGERRPGVYRVASTMRSQGEDYAWYSEDFCSWLTELVDNGGHYERPDLD